VLRRGATISSAFAAWAARGFAQGFVARGRRGTSVLSAVGVAQAHMLPAFRYGDVAEDQQPAPPVIRPCTVGEFRGGGRLSSIGVSAPVRRREIGVCVALEGR